MQIIELSAFCQIRDLLFALGSREAVAGRCYARKMEQLVRGQMAPPIHSFSTMK
jgi:hypothetical protein